MPRVLVPLAHGFEEIEAVTIIDVLRRAGVDVVVAGLAGRGPVRGAHHIDVQADVDLSGIGTDAFDMVILPGGEPGTTALAASPALRQLLQRQAAEERPIAAICAAPRVLAEAGLLRGRAATSHPSVEAAVRAHGARYDPARRVVRDAFLLTSRGPGTALEFALAAVEMLGLPDAAAKLRSAMLAPAV